MRRGRFIVFEGIDGSGKSSCLQTVATHFPGAVITREETDSTLGALIRTSIANRWDPWATTLLFVADRAVHATWIEQQLAAGKDVLCDRYYHSTFAYQCVTLADKMPDPKGAIRALHEPIKLRPDHVIWIDTDPEECMRRVTGRGEATNYEKIEFLHQVRDNYASLAAEDETITPLDGNQSQEEVAEAATELVTQFLS